MSLRRQFESLLPRRHPSHRNGRLRRRLLFQTAESRCMMAADGMHYCDPDVIDPPPQTVPAEINSASQPVDETPDTDQPQPVLLVISNQDFWYQDYADTRAALEAQGLEVVVAATTTQVAQPHAGSGQGRDGGWVVPDLALKNVDAGGYSGIVFSGGWGMSQYQYAIEGTYRNSAYRGDAVTKQIVNDLIGEFVRQDKYVAAVCYGVSVLAYARVDGESLLAGRYVTGFNGPAPMIDGSVRSVRENITLNGAVMFQSAELGDPTTSTDDVYIDGKIITAENFDSAARFGELVGQNIIAGHQASRDDGYSDPPTDQAKPKPVLMVIANQDFYHREYYETRASLEAAGLEVVVAAATTQTATPHAISVVPGRQPNVDPDLALSDANADDYSTIVFVGGYGAASYQYANESTYDNPVYEGVDEVKAIVNDLINDFVAQDKPLAAICNGVTVLAWARVDGVSPIDGHTVASWAEYLPSADGGQVQVTRDQIEANGARQVSSGSIGDPTTVEDDVIVDGNIITAENYDSAYAFGAVLAEQVIASPEPSVVAT